MLQHQDQDQDRRMSVSRPRPRSGGLQDWLQILQSWFPCIRVNHENVKIQNLCFRLDANGISSTVRAFQGHRGDLPELQLQFLLRMCLQCGNTSNAMQWKTLTNYASNDIDLYRLRYESTLHASCQYFCETDTRTMPAAQWASCKLSICGINSEFLGSSGMILSEITWSDWRISWWCKEGVFVYSVTSHPSRASAAHVLPKLAFHWTSQGAV